MKTLEPNELINGLVNAVNAHDGATLASCFDQEAIVRDGGLEYRGPTGVQCWIHNSIEKYDLSLEVIDVSGDGEEWRFDASVSGTFEGSPVQIEHSLTIRDGKIAGLLI